jgi:hypothetical protein
MSVTRRAVIAIVAALTLGGSMVGSTAPAGAHNYSTEGTVTAKEANKLFKQAFKQRCLTVHEARHIVHGSGKEDSYYDEDDGMTVTMLDFEGTKKSHFLWVYVVFEDGCAVRVEAGKR